MDWIQTSCPFSMCQQTPLPPTYMTRQNIGYLYAIRQGARLIYDHDMETTIVGDGPPPAIDNTDEYIDIIYPTGNVWNPYQHLVGTGKFLFHFPTRKCFILN